jgi:hypothetical protein
MRRRLLARSTLPNLLDTQLSLQIDGNFVGSAGRTRMLLQSRAAEVSRLPGFLEGTTPCTARFA